MLPPGRATPADRLRPQAATAGPVEGRPRLCLRAKLALFDWIDAEVVDEVLGTSDACVRIAALSPNVCGHCSVASVWLPGGVHERQ